MDLIQALKKADGKPVARQCWNENTQKYGLVFSGCGNRPLGYGNNVGPWEPTMEQLLADDWCVVESLDDVIEREIDVFWGKFPINKATRNELRLAIRRVLDWQAENGK